MSAKGEVDALVHGADLDAALRFLERNLALHRLQRKPKPRSHR